jgi:MinD-like ATPase involved in chromosome partitioning or flagellar assembly
MIAWGNKIAISVAGGKGGIGKSCFTANLGVAEKFAKLVKRYLWLNLKILGTLPYEQLMNTAIMKRTPFVVKYPESEYMKIMHMIAKKNLSQNYHENRA